MNINITARNIKISESLSEIIHTRLNKLLKYDKYISDIKVILLKENRAEKMELIVRSHKHNYITKAVSSKFEKTLARAIENILIQIHKNRKKR